MNTHRTPAKAHNGPAMPRSRPSPATDGDHASQRPQSPAEIILVAARRWYETALERCARAHGARWPEHCAWVEGYLREELRQRLAARGWRPSHVVV